MISFPLPPKILQKKKNCAVFEIESLYPGYGVTIGNALRRTLLSSLQGAAVTEVKIKGAPHEFSTMPGVLEDTIMILLNIKNLRFKIHEGEVQKAELKIKGEKEIRGSDLELPSQMTLANPETHIATLTEKKSEMEIELQVEKGVGYQPKEMRKAKKGEIGVISVDAIFTPIRNVNFQVENMRVGDRTDFDKLSLEIETDGTITPEQAFFEGCELLIKHFNIIFQGNASEEKETEEVKETAVDAGETSVEEMKFTGRTLNALLKNGIKTAAGIAKRSEKSLLEMEGMGDKAMSEIKRKLKKLGLELKSGE